MQRTGRTLMAGILIGGFAGWGLGYLRLPAISQPYGFLVGFLCGMAVLSGIFLFFTTRNTRSQSSSESRRLFSRPMLFLTLATAVAALIMVAQSHQMQELSQQKEQQILRDSLQNHIRQQQLLEKNMQTLLADIRLELAESPSRSLRESSIRGLALLSAAFEPYPAIDETGEGARTLSPERGRLLLDLLTIDMDSSSWARIKHEVSFAHADLTGTNLQGMNLSGADFRDASFREANLTGARLQDCDLRAVGFERATMIGTDLSRSDMRRAILHEADARDAILRECYLDGADASYSVLTNANLERIVSQWSFYNGVILTGANLSGADLKEAVMNDATLVEANLFEANLCYTDLQNADLHGANLQGASVQHVEWLDKLSDWSLHGVDEIREHYHLIEDSIVRFRDSRYLLVPSQPPTLENKSVQH